MLDVEALRTDDEIIEGHGGDFVAQAARRFVPQGDERAVVRLPLLELPYQRDALHEETLGKRAGDRTVGELRVLVEELEILAEIEDVEEFFVLPRPEEVRTEPRAAAEHLPELRLRAEDFEEDKVHDLQHVDPGVEHVYRNGNVWCLVRLAEILEQRLRIIGLEIDHPREGPFKVRVVGIETFNDELRVVMVLGEDDGLAEPVAGGNLQPVRHQVLEHLVDGVGVEQPFVNRGRVDLSRHITVFIPLDRVPLFLLVLAQIIVSQALPDKSHRHRDRARRDQISVLHRLVEAVGICRHATLELEEPVGVAVDLVLRRCRQADEQAVEVVEDCAVFPVDRAVRLVDHDQVEVTDPEPPLAVRGVVDQVHHRRVG